MDAVKWQKIKEIFNEAVEIEPEKLAVYLDSVCENDPEIRAEVENLLNEDSKDATLFDPFIEPLGVVTSNNPFNQLVGKYIILNEIGEGGMGSVYLAENSEFGNKVALKIVKKGMDTTDLLRRFKTEQKILANLEHPNIAHLLDNGTTEDGLPYYVMEYVEGETLLKFANENQISTRDRLQIFRKICSAVQFAHNRLVVHRDLKPSNILITKDLEPKLLDFGIAKILNPEKTEIKGTATMLGMMTPNYASPEQLRGETVTTASDIYSLGVILYELMTGMIPFNMKQYSLVKMMEVVSNTEPIRPSDAATQARGDKGKITTSSLLPAPNSLKGDLDNIILKALKKEPERRYLSAEQFSEDIRRYLEGLPVKARPDTFGYRTSKFIKRNKLGVSAGILILLSLIGGIIGTSYQASVAQRERNRAEQRFEDLRQLSNNLIFKYNDAISNLPGATSTRAMFVQEATKFLDSLANEQINEPKLQLELANAYLKVGNLQSEISTFDAKQSFETYQKSLKIAENLFNKSHQDYEIQHIFASALKEVGSLQENRNLAINNLKKAAEIREGILKSDAENFENKIGLVQIYSALGNLYNQIQNQTATEYFQKALQISQNLVNEPTATATEWRLFAKTNQTYALTLPPTEAINFQKKAIEFFNKVLDTKPNNIKAKEELGTSYLNLSNLYKSLNKQDLMVLNKQKAIEIFEKLSQSDPKNEDFIKLIAQAKGESKSKQIQPQNNESETVKDIFK
ncbi:MAG: protein kinase [Pyrinomonadaceae bacterium]|nr:protein kinase [Pyrinomonadaceae bacterium]